MQVVLSLAQIAFRHGDLPAARAAYEEGLARAREVQDTVATAVALNGLGEVTRCERRHAEAMPLYAESLALFRQVGDRRGVAGLLVNLGSAARFEGALCQARACFSESLDLHRELEYPRGVAVCLEGLAGVALTAGDPERAARLFGAAGVLRPGLAADMWPADRADYEQTLAAAREALGEAAFTAAWAEGQALSLEEAIAAALAPEADVSQHR
jgi:tetratricopeptide (TPR) repeat protein